MSKLQPHASRRTAQSLEVRIESLLLSCGARSFATTCRFIPAHFLAGIARLCFTDTQKCLLCCVPVGVMECRFVLAVTGPAFITYWFAPQFDRLMLQSVGRDGLLLKTTASARDVSNCKREVIALK